MQYAKWSMKSTLVALLALGSTACGQSDVFGVYGGGVRFVLSGDALTTVAADRVTDLAGALATGEADAVSYDGDREHHDWKHPFFQSANVTFASIVARDLDGVLTDVAMELPATVDVVSMDDGRSITLPDGELPPATYDQLVVVMTQVEGVLYDGTEIQITPPGGGWTAIVPVCPFTVDEGATTVVGLSFNLRSAFRWWENRFRFEPRFRCEMDDDSDVS